MIIKDILYDNKHKLDLYLPETNDFKTIIFIHGGGLVEGEKDYQNIIDLGNLFSGMGYAFASIEYSLYPNAKYPDYIIDSINAINFIKEYVKEYGGSKDIIIAGQSAGAWISLMLALNKEWNIDASAYLIDSAQTTSHFHILSLELELDERMERIDKYAPLYYVDKNTNFSPMLLIYYSNDIESRKEQNLLLYSSIRRFNKDSVLKIKELPGGHCNGSCNKNELGTYDFFEESIKFLKENNL